MATVVCVGREQVLAELQRRVGSAAAGTGGLILLEGPAGIGKTTVARWCAGAAQVSGGSAHMVGAIGVALESPLGIWARLAASAALAGRDVPAVLLDGAVEQLHPHERYAAVLALMHGLGPSPAVVVLDDLHDADESSLAILAQLAPALEHTGTLVVGAWRASAPHRPRVDHEVLDALAPWAITIPLERLDESGIQAMTLAVAGPSARAWAASVQHVLAGSSDGNPLALQTILDGLGVADGARPTSAELAALPTNHAVGDLVGHRLGALPQRSLRLLEAVALAGSDATADLVSDVLGRDVAADLALVAAAGVLEVRPDGRLIFVHPLIGESVVARVQSSPDMHHRLAGALRRRGRPQDLPAIVHHLGAAGILVPPAELGTVALEATAQALRVGDHTAAARCFDLALATDAVGDVAALLLRSSAAHHLAGHREEGWERARRAADLLTDDRADELAHAALAYAQGRDYTIETSGAVALLRRALVALGDRHVLRQEVLAALSVLEMSLPIPVEITRIPGYDEDEANPSATLAWHWITRPEIARPLADEAIELARSSGDQEQVARIATPWRQAHCAPEFLSQRLAVTTHAMASARTSADRAMAAVGAVLDHLEDGNRERIDEALTELARQAEATGDPAVRWRSGQLAAMVAFASGQPEYAKRQSIEAFAHGAQAGENGRWVVHMVQASLIAIETDEDSAPTIDLMAVNSESLAYPPLRAGVAHLLADAGRRDEALRLLPGIVAHVVGDPGREASWLLTAALTADAVAAVGDLGLAETLLPVVLPHADRIAVDGLGLHCHGCLARPLARLALLLGRRDEARQLLLLAQERDSSAGLGRFVLDGAVDLLAMRGSDGECSDEQLESEVASLVDEAIRAGFTRTARRAQTLLHRGGSVLTERQYDVLVAFADGLTYKTAGERLGFSHSTIRHEAIRVYTTLGVRDRDEAVRVARRRGLLPT